MFVSFLFTAHVKVRLNYSKNAWLVFAMNFVWRSISEKFLFFFFIMYILMMNFCKNITRNKHLK